MELIGECKGNNGNGCFMDSCGHDCGCFTIKERSYSEEDMRECWMACLGFNKPDKFNSRVKFEQWFEQFKKK